MSQPLYILTQKIVFFESSEATSDFQPRQQVSLQQSLWKLPLAFIPFFVNETFSFCLLFVCLHRKKAEEIYISLTVEEEVTVLPMEQRTDPSGSQWKLSREHLAQIARKLAKGNFGFFLGLLKVAVKRREDSFAGGKCSHVQINSAGIIKNKSSQSTRSEILS